jgi:methyltransferase
LTRWHWRLTITRETILVDPVERLAFLLQGGFGLPQIAAILLLLQRGAEELHSRRNTSRLLEQGAYEVGRDYYPVVAIAHLGWIAAIVFLIPAAASMSVSVLLAYLVLQVLRYWVIATIGPYWTHRIVTLPEAPVISHGPYRFLRHPNYAVSIAETLVLPLAFGEIALGVIFTAIWAAVLRYKVGLEEQALAERRAAGAAGSCP